MPKLMSDLQIREVSGVDRAANLTEGWMVMKDASPETAALLAQAEALTKGIAPTDAPPGGSNMPDDREAFAKAFPEWDAYTKGLEAAVVTKTAPAPALPTKEETFAKALEALPEAVRKALADTQREASEAKAEVRKAREDKELAELTSMAKSLDSLPDVTEASATVFQKALHGDADAVRDLISKLAAANAVVKTSAAFKEIGSNAAAPDSAEGKIEAFAKTIESESPTTSHAEAMAKAAEALPEVYNDYRLEMNKKNRG